MSVQCSNRFIASQQNPDNEYPAMNNTAHAGLGNLYSWHIIRDDMIRSVLQTAGANIDGEIQWKYGKL